MNSILLLALLHAAPAPQAAEAPSERTEAAAVTETSPERIAWYGTLQSALDEAKRTNRPIFLLAARPEFREVPGFW